MKILHALAWSGLIMDLKKMQNTYVLDKKEN